MSIQLTDGTTGVVVDPTSKGLVIQNPKTPTQAGHVGLSAIRDSGTVTGTPNVAHSDISADNRLRVGMDTALFFDQFNYTAQNTTNWKATLGTMSASYTGNTLVLNSANSTASGNYATYNTYKTVQLYGASTLHVKVRAMLLQAPQINNAVYIGVGTPGTTAAPTDGCYFQYDITGVLRGVCNFAGTITQSAALTPPSANVMHEFEIHVDERVVEFWIDQVLYASIVPNTAAGTGSAVGSGNIFIQEFNSGVPSIAQQVRVATVISWLGGEQSGKPFPHVQAAIGYTAAQGQNGGTLGNTALYVNSSAPGAAVPTNTTAALGSGLGGNFYETMTLAVVTDGIISSYQNPLPSLTQTGRMLMITGIRWYSAIQTAATGGPFVYECGIAFGHTQVSLANAESATTKAPRRIPVGIFVVPSAAAVGTMGAQFVHQFSTPIPVNPGEFIQTIVRNIGTVGTAGIQAHHIAFEGYWE